MSDAPESKSIYVVYERFSSGPIHYVGEDLIEAVNRLLIPDAGIDRAIEEWRGGVRVRLFGEL